MTQRQIFVLAMTLLTSQLTWASRAGDAWKGSTSRIHGRFVRKDNHGAGATSLLLTSTTTITSLSSTAYTTGGSLLKEVAMRDEFLDQNLYAIKLDSAKGQGEFLQTLATLSGCEGTRAQSRFASALRANFSKVFGVTQQDDPGVIADQIDLTIQTDSELRNTCRALDAAT